MKKVLLLLVAMVASLSAWADVEINESNFPDDNFRNWLLEQSYGSDGVLTDEEIAGITEIDVNGIHTYDLTGIEHFTALTHLDCSNNSLEALDLSHNTALTHLDCSSNSLEALDLSHNIALTELQCLLNQLTALDLSYNIELKYLDCMNNQLTALDLSYNIALTELQCMDNQLTALDLSHNTELKYLDCSNNPLTALDLSQNTALITLDCSNNQLTALDVSHNTALVGLNCSINQIDGENMEALVASLPTVDVVNNFGWNGKFSVINLDSDAEQNVITTSQVLTARGKNWTVYGRTNNRWKEYDGSEPVNTIEVDYLDENRETQSHEAIELTGNETSLGAEGQESWYVAKDTLNYTQTITIAGDVHLILADSAVMNIGTKAFSLSGYGINGNEHEETTLTIYGQTLDDDTAGHLNINTGNDCIYINGDYAQHGGNVTANSTYWSGIALWNNLTLTGGTLYVTSSKKAINTVENVDILGGKFSAIGGDKGIYTMEGDVTLGWKNADDEITISSLAYGAPRCTMKIVDGQAFVDSVKNIYDSTTPSNTLWALTNVTLRPYNPRYTFNSTTCELKLLWGEFNKDNKWGDDVTPSAVTSVTATSDVSFTGDCTELFNGFINCTSMDLSNVDTENCNNMSGMFQFCQSLKTLDLSGWNTSRVYYMNGMFHGCRSLETLDLSGWNTRRVYSMNGMFRECRSLETLDLSGWDTSNVNDMSDMFSDCKFLTTIYVGDGWSTEDLHSDAMFFGCTELVGGMGTTYNANHIDAEYAHVDGGVDNPGYLTGLFVITLPESVEHGTLSASQGDKVLVNGDKVITGSTVTLTVTPDNGYELETLTIVTVDTNTSDGAPMRLRGGSVELTPGDEPNTYTFQMPAAPVTVNATFKETVVTGVEDINVATTKRGQRYNLMGQPVGNDYKGVVIQNGKKIIVR